MTTKKLKRVKTGVTGIYRLQILNEATKRWENKKKGPFYSAIKTQWCSGRKRQIERHFETLNEARKFRQFGSQRVDLDRSQMSLGDIFQKYFDWFQSTVRQTTFDNVKSCSSPLETLFDIPTSEFQSWHVDQWLSDQKRPESLAQMNGTRTSFHREIKLLKRVLKFGKEHLEVIQTNSVLDRHMRDAIVDNVKYRANKEKNSFKYLTEPQIEKVLGVIQSWSTTPDRQNLAQLFLFQLETGTRIGEAAAVSWESLDLFNKTVEISSTLEWLKGPRKGIRVAPYTKTYGIRTIPLRASYAKELMKWKLSSGRSTGLVFQSGLGPFSYRQIQSFYDLVLKKAETPFSGTHILRHSFATRFLSKTGNQIALKAIMGHKKLAQTDHYAKIVSEVPANAMAQFDQLLTAEKLL